MNRRRKKHTLTLVICLEIVAAMIGLGLIVVVSLQKRITEQPQEQEAETTISYEEFTEASETELVHTVPSPEISEQLLTVNEWSRPGIKLVSLDYIVVHYLGNPGTTAEQNRHYFESLKDLQNDWMSANYIIGMDGEIIHCVPDDEVAYATSQANFYSISIENCHPDESGQLTDETYESLVELVAYLSDQYDLDRDQILRHYDVTGKDCPKFFVENDGEWEAFLDDVMAYRQSCLEAAEAEQSSAQTTVVYAESKELSEFLKENTEEDD